jgi:DmsE family decaheme c-type cytochrome
MGEPCKKCHEPIVAGFQTSFHARIWQGANDCQSCHGNTDQHLNKPSKQTIVSFSKDGGRSAEELSKPCLGCHESSSHLNMWDAGAHSRNDVGCISCHDIHAGRSTVNQPDVCFECHKSIKTQVSKQSHHPIMEGKVNCSDCHNPHGSASHAMLKAEGVNQLCYQCHADKRGPFIYEHPPVEENCAICHDPHGSRHAKLMTEKIPNLCQDCHDWSRHPGTPYDAKNGISGTAPSNRFFGRSCLNCHGNIHGSAHFENHGLTR